MSINIFKWFQRREGSIRGAKERKVWNIIQSVVLGIWNAAKMVWIGWIGFSAQVSAGNYRPVSLIVFDISANSSLKVHGNSERNII